MEATIIPISHETLLLAKKYAEQLHAGGGTHYTGGHGIVVEGENISIDKDVVVENIKVQEVESNLENTNDKLNQTEQNLNQVGQDLSFAKQELNSLKQETDNNVTRIDNNIDDLQNQIDNIQYVDGVIPVAATTTTLGTVKQISNIEQFTNPSSATAQEIADKFNNLIQNLINAGIMVAGT